MRFALRSARRCRIAGHHVRAAPSRKASQVVLLASFGKPVVGEGVAELVSEDVAETSLLSTPSQHEAHPEVPKTPRRETK